MMGGMGGMGGMPGGRPKPEPPTPEPEFAISEEKKGTMEDVSGDGSLLKLVIVPGDANAGKPATGNHVKCHYTGRLMDGGKFDSSRDRASPFDFQVGEGVISDWSEGVSTMHLGETALFVIAPHKAYGAGGSGAIPPNATLQFEIELLSFSEYEEVHGTDGKVTKKVLLSDDEFYERPKETDICHVKIKAWLRDG